jgi:lipopolysaccharide transport system ATP-binding protein
MSSSSGAPGIGLSLHGVGKRYRTGQTQGLYRYRTLRDGLADGVRRLYGGKSAPERELWALRHVTFDVHEGETVGVIGHNGAGKSTLFKVLAKITPPTEGRVEVRGRLGSLLEVGTGFHPELSGRENVFLSGAVLGMRRSEVARKLDEIVEFAGVSRFIDTPVKRYSTGMYLRLAFAVAAHLEPEILLVDEVLSVGDAQFQRKCLGKMAEVGSSGRTVLFVSHSMPAVMRLCSRVILLDHGGVVADGRPADVIRTYLESHLGTSAERSWPDPKHGPGDAVARLKAVRVCDDRGNVTEEIDIRRPLTIELDYWGLSPVERGLVPNLQVFNEEGVCLFTSAGFEALDGATSSAGDVLRARCTIPGDFLAEGRFTVTVAVSSVNPLTIHAREADAVAFQVVDRSSGDGVRGEFAQEWPGVVRPRLDWAVESRIEVEC